MLDTMLTPRSVAVIGASQSPGKVGHEIVANLVEGGFAGPVVPVNPKADTIAGLRCYPSIADYPDPIDLAVVVVPAPAVLDAAKQALAKGVRAMVVITAGFKEVGEEGARKEQELAALCAQRGVRLLGPNCLGIINTHHRMNASFAAHMPDSGGISVVSQSGALCTAVLDWAAARHLGLAKVVSMGNKADVSETDFLSALRDDPHTDVIVGYLESIDAGDVFMKAAKEAASRKPVVVFKAGVTQAGSKAASSHTGSLAGADMAYGAAFRRSGVVRAETFEDMFDYAMAFAMQPLPRGDKVAIITNAGGPGIMAADAVELSGMHVAHLNRAHASALKAKLPAAASVSNPIDVLGDADPERYVTAVTAALEDENVDAVVVILTPQAMTAPLETAVAIAGCANGDKPVLVSFMGGLDVTEARDALVTNRIPDYPSPERAVRALRAMWEYQQWRMRPTRVLTRFPVNRNRVARILKRNERAGRTQLSEAAAKAILRAYHFDVPDGDLAQTRDDAVRIAEQVGYPVVMKISSPDIIHKSDVGGVRVGLATPAQVEDAFDLIALRCKERVPHARVDGIYVEHMCPGGTEVILGMTRDPQFGPMLMFGLGGIFVEVMRDVSFNIAPITYDEAMTMLSSTKSYALLTGARGRKPVDIAAVAQALQRLSQLVTEFPQIAEMDINPFFVSEPGGVSMAADARITVSYDRRQL